MLYICKQKIKTHIMSFIKVKMDLKFPTSPFIYAYIKSDYEKCNSEQDYIDFVHKCFAIAETTTNEVKREAYDRTAKTVFSLITGCAYESKFL